MLSNVARRTRPPNLSRSRSCLSHFGCGMLRLRSNRHLTASRNWTRTQKYPTMNENELSQCLSRAEKRIQWLTLATLALLGITAALSFDWIQRFRGQQRIRAQGIDIGDGNYTTSIAGGFIVVTNDRENNSVISYYQRDRPEYISAKIDRWASACD